MTPLMDLVCVHTQHDKNPYRPAQASYPPCADSNNDPYHQQVPGRAKPRVRNECVWVSVMNDIRCDDPLTDDESSLLPERVFGPMHYSRYEIYEGDSCNDREE